jgi:hypothetical protein
LDILIIIIIITSILHPASRPCASLPHADSELQKRGIGRTSKPRPGSGDLKHNSSAPIRSSGAGPAGFHRAAWTTHHPQAHLEPPDDSSRRFRTLSTPRGSFPAPPARVGALHPRPGTSLLRPGQPRYRPLGRATPGSWHSASDLQLASASTPFQPEPQDSYQQRPESRQQSPRPRPTSPLRLPGWPAPTSPT